MTAAAPSASYSITVRLEIRNRPGMLGRVTSVIGRAGGDIGAVARRAGPAGHHQQGKELAGVDASPICPGTKDPDRIVAGVKCIAPPSAASTSRISRRRGASTSRRGSRRSWTSRCSTTTSTGPPWSSWPRSSMPRDRQEGAQADQGRGVRGGSGRNGHHQDPPGRGRAAHRGRGRAWHPSSRPRRGHGFHEGPGDRDHESEEHHRDAALAGADVFIGLSAPGVLAVRDVKRMAGDRIVFAMANPCPRSGRNRPSATPASSPPPVRLCEPD
jgi:malate dehydrogenase (oxaloacetate-decarboxylating)